MTSKFKFYEVVKINTNRPEISEANGLECAILGMAENDDGIYWYSVSSLTNEFSWDLCEDDLVSTGNIMKREDFYTGESMSVSVMQDDEGQLKQ
ncbi:Imm31 family immunity protein [Photobacterium sp. 1_MG-2023]|uniref:Imm31 family immunity protein n=1 Tax=Photobacterium sp. 1_MG-2023 TaxID=3062646 RepID=UPI0026E17493|nr:Imm31 family immunity protein [Photobacterium sp. 1_MG-2023]MDO6708624.1 Imm31 family immunity protein [Photobacterium sp. 1_MG-2023]